MPTGLEVYRDGEVIQVGRELDVAFLTTWVTANALQNKDIQPSRPIGFASFLQTGGADIYADFAYWMNVPSLKDHDTESRWTRMSWRDTDRKIQPVGFGLEIYDSAGNIEFNSGVDPIKVLDYVTGTFTPTTGTNSRQLVIDKQYDRPIAVMLDFVPHLNGFPRIVANTFGKFYVDYLHDVQKGVGNGGANIPKQTVWNYRFIVIDASNQ